MQAPFRLVRALRTDTEPGLLAATAVSVAVFVATPVSLGSIADRFHVGPGTAGLFSAAQLGVFVVASYLAGRVGTPNRRLFVGSLTTLAAVNALSALTGPFAVFVLLRAASGASLGVLTWLAWSQVFGDDAKQGDITVVGPVTGVFAAPLFGLLLEWGDDRAVFLALAVAALVPVLRVPDFDASGPERPGPRRRPVPQAAALIAALTMATLGGSAVFVYVGVMLSDRLGMTPGVVSLVFAANAVAGIPSSRWRGRRPWSGTWLVLAGLAAVASPRLEAAWMAWPVLSIWGFAFWAGVPGLFTLLAQRSAYPAERAGDAQSAMAAGRAVGPLLGGALVSVASFPTLGLVGGGVLAAGGLAALGVEWAGARAAGAAAAPAV